MGIDIKSLTEAKVTRAKATAIVSKRHEIERRVFLARIIGAQRALRAMMDHYTEKVVKAVLDKADDRGKINRINEIIHEETVFLRASLRIWLNSAIRDSARMGFKNIGDALVPIFKANQESVRAYTESATIVFAMTRLDRELEESRKLFEAKLSSANRPNEKLTFGLKYNLASKAVAAVALSSPKYRDAMGTIVRKITKSSIAGTRPSDRIWDLTNNAERNIKRIVANGMGAGDNPKVIASRLKRYVDPKVRNASDLDIETGPGVYRSPYRNAYRLAKTEMNRAYTKATVAFAKDKAWIKDGEIVLSPLHDEYDECDELAAGGPYTPEQADAELPAHPHCGCRYVPSIDPKYLGEEEAENNEA